MVRWLRKIHQNYGKKDGVRRVGKIPSSKAHSVAFNPEHCKPAPSALGKDGVCHEELCL